MFKGKSDFILPVVGVLLSFVVFSNSGCVSTEYNTGTHRQDIMFYSSSKEITLGQNISRQIAKQFKISSNPSDIERVNRIGQKIAAVCDRRELHYYFYIINEDTKNAFSIPGGYVYIYKGLLDMFNTDDELAFVLAHEIGHIVCRHSIKKLQASLGYNLLILASTQAKAGPDFTRGLSFALAQIFTAYSRQDEFAADSLAVKYTKEAGFNPKAGIKVMEKLYKEEKKSERPLSYFRTHPYAAQRIRNIKEHLRIPLSADDYIN